MYNPFEVGVLKNNTQSKYAKCINDYYNSWGNCEQVRGNLKIGTIYEVEKIESYSWHTKIYLKGFDKPFNSVHFELRESEDK